MCFNDYEEDINVACNQWFSVLNKIIKKCFRKIRLKKEEMNPELQKLFEEKERLKTNITLNDNSDPEYESYNDELENVLEEIADICAQKNKDIVEEYLGNTDDGLEGFNQAKVWTLKKKLSPKNSEDPPMAKKDKNGTLITDKKLLEKLYLDTYVDRLKPNKMVSELEKLETLKEYLFKLRYNICKAKQSQEWSNEDLENALKCMKNNKARDAQGHLYELFRFGGKDLKDSMVRMFNIIKKKKKEYPDIFKPSNITSLYKKKGEKADLNNDRGIFNIVKIRSILDRLVYNDKYSIIDSHMSPSNIGGRKNRNIRDHFFVINSILHDFKQNKKENIDIEIYDVKKCFDKMWSNETANDFYDAGVKDDAFILVSNSNKSCKIAVKTPE